MKLFLLVLVSGLAVVMGSSLSSNPSLSAAMADDASKRGHGPNNHIPPNHDTYPDGFWFGTQNLLCVLGVQAYDAASDVLHRLRAKRSPTISPQDISHRILYYRGEIFEWGTGSDFYHYGPRPCSADCAITWERSPAAVGTCPLDMLRTFTVNYSTNFGPYNLFTNNCHHYVNRVSEMLDSENCSTEAPGRWASGTRAFWRMLGHVSAGRWPSEIRQLWSAQRKETSQPESDAPTVD